MLVERTDEFEDHDPNTALRIGGENQQTFQMTFYGVTSTDVRIHNIGLSFLHSTMPVTQIESLKLYDGAVLIAVEGNLSMSTSNTMMNVDLVIPAGTTKQLWLKTDLKPTAPANTVLQADLISVQANEEPTNDSVSVLRLPDYKLVSWIFPLSSAIMNIVP